MEFKIIGKNPLVSIFYKDYRITQVVTVRYAKQLIYDYKENKLNAFWKWKFNNAMSFHGTDILNKTTEDNNGKRLHN